MSSETNNGGEASESAGVPGAVPNQPVVAAASAPSTSNPIAASLAGVQQQVDPNAALMMTNAAAVTTLAAVAAQTMKQMTGQQQQPPKVAAAGTAPSTDAAASLFAALQGARNPLFTAAPAAQVAPSQAALLAALTGQPAQPQHALAGLFQGQDAAAALLRSGNGLLSPPAAASRALTSPASLSNMHTWTAEQLGKFISECKSAPWIVPSICISLFSLFNTLLFSLEQHVAMLRQANQSVPQSVALLLNEAQRKEKKKTAKRIANRKSASTSRARKKALVEEMTKTNARLKRQAMILSLLPDLVITTTPEGEITFCSAQVERILQYKPEDLVGAQLYDLLLPLSRDALKVLIESLTHPGKAKAARTSAAAKARRKSNRRLDDQRNSGDETGTSKNTADPVNGNSNASARESAGVSDPSSQATSGAAIVSEQSFPLSVVEVESKQRGQNPKPSATNENLDTSASNSGGKIRRGEGSLQNCILIIVSDSLFLNRSFG